MAVIYRTGFDGVWTAADYATAWSVFPTRRNGLDVVASSGKSVTVSSGSIWAFGGSWVNTASASVSLTTPSSGTRWDLIALRINYSTKVASLVAVDNPLTDSQTIPTSANVSIGTLYDIPLALVQNSSGSSGVGTIVPAFAPTPGGSQHRLILTSSQSASDSNYRSLALTDDPNFRKDVNTSFNGHTFSLPAGAWRIGGQVAYGGENDSTPTGRRGAGIAIDPSASTWNSGSVPGTIKVLTYIAASVEEVMVPIPTQIYDVRATTNFMLFARHTANETLNISNPDYKTFLNIERVS